MIIGLNESHLGIEIESLERVDGMAVFGDIVLGDLVEAVDKRRRFDQRLVIGIV